jgi:transcriptional regulator with XRE-family HTH domain
LTLNLLDATASSNVAIAHSKHMCFAAWMGRPSALRHTVAVLRSIAGLTQKELAAHIDRSRRSVQAVELGQVGLTTELAQKISDETGIELDWLLANDPAKPAPARTGGNYTRKTFLAWQRKIGKSDRKILASTLAEENDKLMVVVRAVAKTGLTLKRLLAESMQAFERQTALLNEVVERGQVWKRLATASQRRISLTSEALQSLAGKPRIEAEDISVIGNILRGRDKS